jgi:3-oxoacyl-[acyl-carrier-protein] synthase-1
VLHRLRGSPILNAVQQPSLPCRLSALGIVNALGVGADEVWARLLDGEPSRLVDRDDLAAERVLRVGAVGDVLPGIPARLAPFDCRNNAMALCALSQIEPAIARAISGYGAERIGVVMGTSTSGVSDAELAIGHELREGGLTPTFAYAQLEFGGLASFVAGYLGVQGPAYSLSTACSSGGARAGVGAVALAARHLRRRDRGRRRHAVRTHRGWLHGALGRV